MTIEKSYKPNSTSSAQDHTASTPLQYTHIHTMQNYSVSVTAYWLHSFTWFRNNNNKKSCSSDTAPRLEVVSLPAKAARLQLLINPGNRCLLQYPSHLLHCFSVERKWLLFPGTHGSLSRRGSLFSTIQLQSLRMWRVIAFALYWGFLAAVTAHPIHCLWCMLSKQSPRSS